MTEPREAQLLAMQSVQAFLDSVRAESPNHAVNMLMAMISATAHVIAGMGGHEVAAQACDKVAQHMRTKPRLPQVQQVYGETEKSATVAGNDTIN